MKASNALKPDQITLCLECPIGRNEVYVPLSEALREGLEAWRYCPTCEGPLTISQMAETCFGKVQVKYLLITAWCYNCQTETFRTAFALLHLANYHLCNSCGKPVSFSTQVIILPEEELK